MPMTEEEHALHQHVLARAWYRQNRERRLAQNKRWRDANKPHVTAKAHQRHVLNKARDSSNMRAWYQANKKRVKTVAAGWKKANPDKVRVSERKRILRLKYGMTLEQYEAWHQAQKGRCAICRAAVKLQVDHDHATERVRGLLCCRCNMGLGYFRDRATFLRAAARYLDKTRGQ